MTQLRKASWSSLLTMVLQNKEKPMAVRSSNIVAARGTHSLHLPSHVFETHTPFQPLPTRLEPLSAREAWTR